MKNTKICMVIGSPVEHSLSPIMHNTGYKALGVFGEFFYTSAEIKSKDLARFIDAVKLLGIRGVSCTIPDKIEIMKYLDELDETARKIGAVNTVVNNSGVLKGYNTDWLGIIEPIKNLMKGGISDKKVALIGAGGASRAVLYGLIGMNFQITIFNRNLDKARDLALEFGVNFESLDEIYKVKDFDVIINATPIGMGEYVGISPVPKEFIDKNHICFDIVYNPMDTEFLKLARIRGAKVIYGIEMLLYQGIAQFEMFTGLKAPVDKMRKALIDNL